MSDGFRPRKKRGKGWLKRAIKDGSVRDPSLPPEPEKVYPEGTAVIRPPGAELIVINKHQPNYDEEVARLLGDVDDDAIVVEYGEEEED